jgi:predicted nucleic acid-binding protein
MVYADTCLLVSVFLRDAGTEAALAWLDKAAGKPIMASHWSLTEFSSAAASLARQKLITAKLHAEVSRRFRGFAEQRLTLEPPLPTDFERASSMVEHYATGLRAGDAVHLALCTRMNATLCTADKIMAKAAKTLSINVQLV